MHAKEGSSANVGLLSRHPANVGHVIGKKCADHDEVISRLARRSKLRRFIQVPPKYATGAGKGTSSFGDSFKEKRDNVKENSQLI
jgi:hypothetical protein